MSLVDAAQVSGYSADHLGSLVRQGKLPNVGRKNAPRVRRTDLPIKKPTRLGHPRKKRKATEAEDITNIAKKLR